MNSTKAPRKPRIQGKIARLPAKQRERIHEWMRENLYYDEIARRVQREFGVKIAISSLSTYYSTHYAEIFRLPVNAPIVPSEGGE